MTAAEQYAAKIGEAITDARNAGLTVYAVYTGPDDEIGIMVSDGQHREEVEL